jgi:hypothetical protein
MPRIDNQPLGAQDEKSAWRETNKPWLKAAELTWPNKIVDILPQF